MLVVSRVAGIRRECPIRRAVPVCSSGRQHAGATHCMHPLLTCLTFPYAHPHTFLSISNHGLELNLTSQFAPKKLRMVALDKLGHLGQN